MQGVAKGGTSKLMDILNILDPVFITYGHWASQDPMTRPSGTRRTKLAIA
jgi:hypothetical protein